MKDKTPDTTGIKFLGYLPLDLRPTDEMSKLMENEMIKRFPEMLDPDKRLAEEAKFTPKIILQ